MFKFFHVEDATLEYGGMVSSSNTYDVSSTENVVYISTDGPLVWSMTL